MTTTKFLMTKVCISPGIENNNESDYICPLSNLAVTVAKKELREDKNTRDQALKQFREWVEKHPQLVNCRTDDVFLLKFLRIRKFNIPMAEHNLVKYLNFRQSLPHLSYKLDFKEQKVAQLIDSGYLFASPIRDSKGRRVIIGIASRLSPTKYSRVDMAKVHQITYETVMEDEETQVMGVTHFGDVQGVSMSHICMWSPMEFITCLRIGEQAFPMRHKEIHVINVHAAFKVVYDYAEKLLSSKMKERFMAHSSIEECHKHLDARCLPKEYGGTMPMSEMIDLWKEEIAGKRDVLLALDNMKSNVPIRRRQQATINSMEGSFKKLEVD